MSLAGIIKIIKIINFKNTSINGLKCLVISENEYGFVDVLITSGYDIGKTFTIRKNNIG
jgi:hypothetical protein